MPDTKKLEWVKYYDDMCDHCLRNAHDCYLTFKATGDGWWLAAARDSAATGWAYYDLARKFSK